MQKSRLIELIATFDKKEVKEVKKFLNSPFFNHREDVKILFEWIISTDKNQITKENAAKILFVAH